ncbi:MAG: hypothetical protein V8T36_11815 [Ruthenibacterium lactatiformans]
MPEECLSRQARGCRHRTERAGPTRQRISPRHENLTVPAHHHSYCADIPVEAMRFILPEDISVSGTSDSCGNRRHFTARVVAHYIDFNSATAGL